MKAKTTTKVIYGLVLRGTYTGEKFPIVSESPYGVTLQTHAGLHSYPDGDVLVLR